MILPDEQASLKSHIHAPTWGFSILTSFFSLGVVDNVRSF